MSDQHKASPESLNVSRETYDRLEVFQKLVLKWNDAINLVSKASASDIWGRHILDSAQIAEFAPTNPQTWVDIGSGGGFPGLVTAIQFKDLSPTTRFVLIESDARKATFLRQAIRTLELGAEVMCQRVESVRPLGAAVVSARALAPLSLLLEHAQRHLAPEGRAFFPKGETFADEIRDAQERWHFRFRAHISRTDARAAILEVDQIDKI